MEEMSHESKLSAILAWAKTKPCFDASTFENISSEWIDTLGKELTFRQMQAIDNVYYKWKVDKWEAANSEPVCEACRGSRIAYWSDGVYGECYMCS
jgi:hypothetical protein